MILANQGLVYSVARAYVGRGLEFEDVVQEGAAGLIRAVDRYDPRRGTAFSTYAVFWIRQAILKALNDTARLVRIPAHLTPTAARVHRALDTPTRTGTPPTPEDAAHAAGISLATCSAVLRATAPAASLDVADPDRTALMEVMADPTSPSPEDAAEREGLRVQIRTLLNVLPGHEREVIRKRFGFEGLPVTLDKIATELGVSAERVRQVERRAIARLKAALRVSRLGEP